MNKEDAINLKNKLLKWSKDYHTLDNPKISDIKYDSELEKLRKYEELYPDFVTNDSPTQNIGGPISKKFKKFIHINKMYSLANAFNKDDLLSFDKRMKKILNNVNNIKYITELKIDGVSISLHYINGYLRHAITRGDGIQGEDITKNIMQIANIPNKISYKKRIEIRGEIFLNKKTFHDLNKAGNNFANPRNAAAGTIRQLDSRIVKSRKLSSYFYSLTNLEEHKIFSQEQVLEFLLKHKFNINKEYKIYKNINDVINDLEYFEESRYKYDYEIDGLVIKINDAKLYEKIGYTSKFPKYMIAYKFRSQLAQTKLIDIFATIGRTGKLTYNAKLESVNLMGSTISAATLHNADYIKKININIGDYVNIKKAGDIIPKVISIWIKNNNIPWKEIYLCPSCNSKLIKNEDEVDQYCINTNCPAIIKSKLEHFVSRDAMNIEGLGPELISLLYEKQFLSSFSSIYKLKDNYEKLILIKGLGVKSIEKIIASIEESKTQSLDRLLFAIGIRHIGAKTARLISNKFTNITEIRNAKYNEIINIKDIGTIVIHSLFEYFQSDKNNLMINELISLGINPHKKLFINNENFKEYNFVITGKLKNARKYYEDNIYINGGNITSSLSSKTNYLITGENPGSKLKKAKLLNIRIIDEDEFNILLKGDIDELH